MIKQVEDFLRPMTQSTCKECGYTVDLPENPNSKNGTWEVKDAMIYLIDKQRKHKCND